MKVLLADDLTALRVHLTELLRDVAGMDLLSVAQDAKEATELALAWKPDVLILDCHMRGGRGIDVLQAVKSAKPATVVIISTIFSSADDREAWLRRGADFFFDKSTEFEKIAGVLRTLKLCTAPEPGPGGGGDKHEDRMSSLRRALGRDRPGSSSRSEI